ncbi:MAG TPA: hypothetical protein VMF07_20980 [Solirubrobacteraceae bacterium]|nr:hypothetical protein [Solirubrobacteraceae bacterium]
MGRVLAAGAVVLSVGAIGAGSAQAAPGCTDSWTNASGGSWDTATNWSTGAVPTSSDIVCINEAGTYTVVVGNETITVAALTVGGTGATPTLQIGNGGSSFPHITVTGTAATVAGGTISDGWGGTFSAGALNNAGTFLVPSTGFTSSYTFGNVTNSGAFTVDSIANVSLSNGDTFDNAAGTISVGGTSTALALTSPTAGQGTLELDSGGTVNIGSGDSFTVADVTAIHGGTICGTPLTIGSADGGTGGTLAFATTPGTGPACGSGATDQVFITNTASTLSGTIPAAYTVAAGDGGSSFNTTTLSGNVINQGTFEPGYGATINGSGTTNELTNQGTILVPSTGYNTVLDTTLANTGTVTADGNLYATLSTGQTWTNGTKGTNGTISVAATRILALSSPSAESSTFTQDGTIDNLGTFNVADPIQINGGSLCGNALNLGAGDGQTADSLSLAFATKLAKGAACAKNQAKGHVFIYNVTASINSNIPKGYTVAIGDGGSSYFHVSTPGSLTNAGTLEPGFGGTLTVNGTLTNSGKLTVPISGYNTGIVATSVANTGTLTADASLTVTGSLTNSKALALKASTTVTLPEVSITGTFTQTAKGTLTDPLGTKGHGLLNINGTASLAGKATLTGKPALKSGTQVEFLESSGDSGTFSKVTGAFTLTYNTANVTATAT